MILLLACSADPLSPPVDRALCPADPVGPRPPGLWDPPAPAGEPCPGCGVPSSAATLDLPLLPDTLAMQVVPDLGGDGSVDVAEWGRAVADEETGWIRLWPRLLEEREPVLLHYATLFGLEAYVATPDATGDGVGDLWILPPAEAWALVPGPFVENDQRPEEHTVATFADLPVQLADDVDGDGIADLASGDGPLFRCAGPFSGPVDLGEHCVGAQVGDWLDAVPLGRGDAEGDGVPDLVVGVTGRGLGGHAAGGLAVVPGDFGPGAVAPRVQVQAPFRAWREPTDAALADLDGDGLDDLAWAEPLACGAGGELRVAHGPWPDSATLEPGDATLRLVDLGAQVALAGTVDPDGDGAPWLVATAEGLPGALLIDGSTRGTTQPGDVAWVLGSDTRARTADLGDFDGDAVDDVLVVDWEGDRVYLFLGTDLP